MPGKRSGRNKVQRFFCPYCQERLWRLGGTKHHLLLPGIGKNQQNLTNDSKYDEKASEEKISVDPDQWIEEFFCSEHSKLWMLVRKTPHNRLIAVLASNADWQKSAGSPIVDSSSCSASEFTVRMSRRADIRLSRPNQ
jgi:hypothetical protein